MNSSNVLFICSDQHARNALGCYGHPFGAHSTSDGIA